MGLAIDLTFWTEEWPLIRNAPHLAIGDAIVIALAVWAFVSWVDSSRHWRMAARIVASLLASVTPASSAGAKC